MRARSARRGRAPLEASAGRAPHEGRARSTGPAVFGVAALLIVAALAGAPDPARAQTGESEARARLTGLAASVREARGPAALGASSDAIERANGVVLAADGRPVDLGFLSADIQAMRSADARAAAEAAARAARRLEVLADALPDADARAVPGPDRARLAEVLSHRDFKGADPFARTFARFVEAVQEWQRRNLGLSYAGEGGPTASIPAGALIALAALAVVLAGAIAVAALRHGRRGVGGSPRSVQGAAGQASGRSGPSPEEAERRAAVLAQKGDLAEAVRVLFASIPGRLERAGLVPGRREITDRDMVAAVRAARGPAAEPLSDLVEVFERSFYGGRPVDEASWSRFRARFSELVRAVEPATGRAPDPAVS